ncbi:MAG: hypothetical protein AB1512_10355 [Thermodesulfobacteriota bacterium]
MTGEFSKARDLFHRGAEGDALCRVFLARCERFSEEPPAKWEGVWVYEA